MTKNTNSSFVAYQIALQGRFANKVQVKEDSSKSQLRNPLEAKFNVSSIEAINSTLLLAQLLAPLSKPRTSFLPPKSRAAARRVAGGNTVVSGQEAIKRLAKNKNVSVKTNQEELVRQNTKKISKELSQRRQNLPAVNQTEIKEFIEEQKASNPNQPVDFSCYSGRQLVGSPFEVTIPGTSFGAKRFKNVVSDLDVHDTNFFKNINVDGCHFRGGNFSGCRFGDTIGVTFDGSDLTNADMSKTKQTALFLGGEDDDSAISSYIDYVRKNTINQEVISDPFIKDLISYIEGSGKINVESKSTKFVKVNIQGSTLDKIESRYQTDFNGTSFGGVVLKGIDNFHGKNVRLNGAMLETSDGQIKNITNPITPQEIAREATPYVAAMLQNNVLTRKNGKTTTIALSKDCLGKTKQQMLDKGMLNSESIFLDPTEEDFEKILNLYNKEFKKFNVIFTKHKEDEPYDYFISFCHDQKMGMGGADSDGRLDWTNQGIIALGNHSISTPYIQLHELGHILGAAHPFDVGIKEVKCSLFASIMCYESALDIMFPLDYLSKYPARISPEMLENFGIQDKSHYNLIFGKNPDYQEQDITTNLKHDQIRIIDGDKNFKNIAHIDTTSLPKDIRYAVLDAKEAIGTCFKFPCDPNNIAEGIDEGTLVVFYTKNQNGGDEISGVALLYGGRANNIFIDGKEVIPKRGVTSTPTPTSTSASPAPTSPLKPITTTSVPKPEPTSAPPAPTPLPAPTVASTQPQLDPILSTTPPQKSNKDVDLIGPLLGGAAALLIIVAILALKNRSRFRNNNNKDIELTEFPPADSNEENNLQESTKQKFNPSIDSASLKDALQDSTNSDQQSLLGINADSPGEHGIKISGGIRTDVMNKIPLASIRKITGKHYSQRGYSRVQGE